MSKITKGCWIRTAEGDCVCTDVTKDGVTYRYPATPYSAEGKPELLKQIWVEKSESLSAVRYSQPPNEFSLEVVKLKGPYGNG